MSLSSFRPYYTWYNKFIQKEMKIFLIYIFFL